MIPAIVYLSARSKCFACLESERPKDVMLCADGANGWHDDYLIGVDAKGRASG